MTDIKSLRDLPLKNRKVFMRVDFNVPLKQDGDHYVVADDTRILGALPSIKFILETGGKCILASHLGRPDGRRVPKYSLEPVAARLSELLGMDVILPDDCVGDAVRSLAQQLRPGQVMLLENLRFHQGEEDNAADFVSKLQELCETYVSDAFGTVHRAHASTYGLARMTRDRGMGFLVEKELHALIPLRDAPARPFVLLMGGAKISDKMAMVEHFLPKVNTILIGGAMAYAFLKAKGVEIGKSLCDHQQIHLATRLLKSAAARNVSVLLPIDHLVTPDFKRPDLASYTKTDVIPVDQMAVDIGPQTLNQFATALQTAETIFWNGPMGVFEVPEYAKGTSALAEIVAGQKAKKMAGGGDVVAAITQAKCEDRFDFISTGGGATLEFLEGKTLPGIEALET